MEAERGRARSRRRRRRQQRRQHQQRRGETAPGAGEGAGEKAGVRVRVSLCVWGGGGPRWQRRLFCPKRSGSQEGCRRRGPWPVEDAEVEEERLAPPRSSATRGFGLRVLLPPGPLSRAARHDEDGGESAAGRALRAVSAAPTKGSCPAAPAACGLRTLSGLPFPVPGRVGDCSLASTRGGEARVRRGRSCRGSVPRSCRRGCPCWFPPAGNPPAGSRPAPLTRARRPNPLRRRRLRAPLVLRERDQGELPPPLSPRSPAPRAAWLRSPLPARISSRRRRPRPRLPPPPSFPARVVANRRPPSCSGSRPDPRQPPAPAQPKRPIFAAASVGSPEGGLGCAEHRPGRWRGCGKEKNLRRNLIGGRFICGPRRGIRD
ncbi:uncharacterized protein [Tursiops truncatus]|uniref:Skin secretory protein xP2-like n=1 Tax=Tursiops truncatus TaxID=9739 RepID=A0A6J3PS78_TURTR|nr:skin secretory protein xP2-like [Tursiops truncatus]